MTPMTPKVIRVESAFGYKDAQVEKNAVVDIGDTVLVADPGVLLV